jgi:uncharacterized membrane protein YfcA
MRAFLASPLGFLIGLSLGAVGGGGSILAVPVLVYVAGQQPKEATTTSLVLVALTALAGLPAAARSGRVRVVPGLIFGLVGIGGSLLGSHWNEQVDENVLLLAFAGLMVVAAFAMSRPRPERTDAESQVCGADTKLKIGPKCFARVLVAGSFVGLLTGFFGVGGGFVIVPALVLAIRFSMPVAAGTSLLVIAVNSAIALFNRRGAGSFDWAVIVPFAVASMSGVLVGSRVADRVDAKKLSRWFVTMILVIAAYTGVRSAMAL